MIDMKLGDCMDLMRGLSDNVFDLAIVDPPYGIGVNSMNMGGRQTVRPDDRSWDDAIPPPEYFIELTRVSRFQIIWGGNYFGLPASKTFFVWDKGESMYGRDFAECEQAWSNLGIPAGIFKLNPNQPDRIHPTQKPIALYKWLLTRYAKPGWKILDTHGGSGSIAIACHDLGFDLTWIEKDPDYYEAAVKRYKEHAAQGDMYLEMIKPTPKNEELF